MVEEDLRMCFWTKAQVIIGVFKWRSVLAAEGKFKLVRKESMYPL